jgi:hypothetical protein
MSPAASNRAGARRVLQQHERRQPHGFWLCLKQPQQEAAEPKCLVAKVSTS